MEQAQGRTIISEGKAILGIEFGSTRIKGVLVNHQGEELAQGGYDWENHLVDGIWTYGEEEIQKGLQECYRQVANQVQTIYGVPLVKLEAMGISGMMHGYLPFDVSGNLLVPFRTWRNNITGPAADALTQLFQYNIPQRWSIAHLYQAILNEEPHVKDIAFLTTIAGFLHWRLTGEKKVGVGEASGIFPIDPATGQYYTRMLEQFETLPQVKAYPLHLTQILPQVLSAGEMAGTLTLEGAKLLDPTGTLLPGTPLCPPEGDAGTGMVATNSVTVGTGNVSAGTSAFAMVVLEKELKQVHRQLDMVTTPGGNLVAMAHSNNCTTDINAWCQLFRETLEAFGCQVDTGKLYETLFLKALGGDPEGGGLLSYCFYSGEHGVGLTKGCPMVLHPAGSHFTLENFMKTQIYTSFGAMKMGMDILMKEEGVKVTRFLGHGGIFKTKGVAQKILASALGVPVMVMDTAGEGGAWGIALLAAYMIDQKTEKRPLEEFLAQVVFAGSTTSIEEPDAAMEEGYEIFLERYKQCLPLEQLAVDCLKK